MNSKMMRNILAIVLTAALLAGCAPAAAPTAAPAQTEAPTSAGAPAAAKYPPIVVAGWSGPEHDNRSRSPKCTRRRPATR